MFLTKATVSELTSVALSAVTCWQMVDDWAPMSTAAWNWTSMDSTSPAVVDEGPRWRFVPLAAVPLWILVGNSLVLIFFLFSSFFVFFFVACC